MVSFFVTPLLLAQFVVSPNSNAGRMARSIFEEPPREEKMGCKIEPLRPRLGFSFVHWSGYGVTMPVKEMRNLDKQQDVLVAIAVQPAEGKTVYMAERMTVPQIPEPQRNAKGLELNFSGGYYVGPGEYKVRLYVGDSNDRGCRKEWKIRVKGEKLPLKLSPNEVSAVGGERWRGFSTSEKKRKVTVVVEAGPMFPRRNTVRLSGFDRSLLLSAMVALFEGSSYTEAAVIAIDPRNRKVVFSTERFTGRDIGRLGRSLGEINLGVVSLDTLQGPSAGEFLETVVSERIEKLAEGSEDVVFIGPAWGVQGKVSSRLKEIGQGLGPTHHVALTLGPFPADGMVASFVRSTNGDVRTVRTPQDLAGAVEKIVR